MAIVSYPPNWTEGRVMHARDVAIIMVNGLAVQFNEIDRRSHRRLLGAKVTVGFENWCYASR